MGWPILGLVVGKKTSFRSQIYAALIDLQIFVVDDQFYYFADGEKFW